jgi:hypothetical protein
MAAMLQRWPASVTHDPGERQHFSQCGRHDLPVIDEIGELIFHGVNLKPGKPLFRPDQRQALPGPARLSTSALPSSPAWHSPFAPLLGKSIREKGGGRLAETLRLEGRRQMLAVDLSGELVYPWTRQRLHHPLAGGGWGHRHSGSRGVLEKGEGEVELFW